MQTKENNQSVDDLITGFLTEELSGDETRDLISWIRLKRANKQYFDEFCEIWITAKARLKNPGYNFHEGFWKFKQRIKHSEDLSNDRNNPGTFKKIIRYAAIFIIAFFSSSLLFFYAGKNRAAKPDQTFIELNVPFGSRAKFSLSDGTIVTLNAGSRLKYDNHFGIADRVVEFQGEGYFNVATNEKKPFIVKTSHLNVIALGTEFNVKAYEDEKTIETTLVKGIVKVEEITEQSTSKTLVLKPNQKLTFFKENSSIVSGTATPKGNCIIKSQSMQAQKSIAIPTLVAENINVDPVISWKENRWIFEKQSLLQIAVELERRYDVQIIFESERLKTFRFTGIIVAEPIEQVLEVMSISAPINFKLKGNVVTLSENRNFEKINKSRYKINYD
jgi:transmembrane sensor